MLYSKRYYSAQFANVFGLPLEESWNQWISFEAEFQKNNLAAVREHPLTKTTPLASQALGSISRSFIDSDDGVMVGAFRYPGVVAHVGLMSLADGSIERVTDIKGPKVYPVTSPAYDQLQRHFSIRMITTPIVN